MKKFYLCAIFLGIFVLFTNYLYADNFYPNGDAKDCDFSTVSSITYSKLPHNCTSENCIQYNSQLVKGNSSSYISNHTINNVVKMSYPAYRYNGVADKISVPPNTTVDFGMYVNNYSGHLVGVRNLYLFMSRRDATRGDFTRLGASATYGVVDFKYFTSIRQRYGKVATINWNKNYPANSLSNPPKGENVYSFTTIQPVSITSRTIDYSFNSNNELVLHYTLKLKNNSSYNLANIKITDNLPNKQTYELNSGLNSNESKTYQYNANMGREFSNRIYIAPVIIHDPNYHNESAAFAPSVTSNPDPDTRTLLLERNDLYHSTWYGKQPDFATYPQGPYFTIQLIPYTIYSNEFHIDIPVVQDYQYHLFTNDQQGQDILYLQPNDTFSLKYLVTNMEGYVPNEVVAITIKDDNDLLSLTEIEPVDYDNIYHNRQFGKQYEVHINDNILPGNHETNFTIVISIGNNQVYTKTLSVNISSRLNVTVSSWIDDEEENLLSNVVYTSTPIEEMRIVNYIFQINVDSNNNSTITINFDVIDNGQNSIDHYDVICRNEPIEHVVTYNSLGIKQIDCLVRVVYSKDTSTIEDNEIILTLTNEYNDAIVKILQTQLVKTTIQLTPSFDEVTCDQTVFDLNISVSLEDNFYTQPLVIEAPIDTNLKLECTDCSYEQVNNKYLVTLLNTTDVLELTFVLDDKQNKQVKVVFDNVELERFNLPSIDYCLQNNITLQRPNNTNQRLASTGSYMVIILLLGLIQMYKGDIIIK